MRWLTIVLPVTLLYSLSFVNAIPHEVDEKRHWQRARQDPGSSTPSVPVASGATPSSGGSSPSVSSNNIPTTTSQPSVPSSSLPSSSTTPTTTPPATSDPSSQLTTTSPASPSSSSTSTSTSTSTGTPPTYSPSSSTIANSANTHNPTSYLRFSSTVGLPSSTVTPGGNAGSGNGSGTSFLKNKAAMGTVFTIVGLVGAAIVVGAGLFLFKKARKRRQEDELDTYFEKLPATRSNNRDLGGNDFGLGPSATDLTSPTNNQSYVSRDVHYGSTGQFQNPFANYAGLEYPPERGSVAERPSSFAPGTAYAAAMDPGQYRYEGQVEDPNTVPNHPFADSNNRLY